MEKIHAEDLMKMANLTPEDLENVSAGKNDCINMCAANYSSCQRSCIGQSASTCLDICWQAAERCKARC